MEELGSALAVSVGAAVSVALLVTSVICYLKFFRQDKTKENVPGSRIPPGKRVVVLFIDAPDPDNPASAAAVVKHLLKRSTPPATSNSTATTCEVDKHLHLVLTGRPTDFRTAKVPPSVYGGIITRQTWERYDHSHGQRALEDSAARLKNYLAKCRIDESMVTFYNGGIAPVAPISDRVHDWDFLFDRKDLITDDNDDRGNILTPDEYQALVARFCAMSPTGREEKIISLLRPFRFPSLNTLRRQLESKTCQEITIFLGGPATAVVELFKGKSGDKIRQKVTGLYGMFGCLDPGKKTLTPNQFNVACDIPAASELFANNMFPMAEKYLIPTETAQVEPVMMSSIDFQEKGFPVHFVALQRLWESTHKGNAQPMFDVLPVMAFMDEYKACFKWKRKRAILEEISRKKTQVFSFLDSHDDRHPFVAEAQVLMSKEQFLDFLKKTWT